MSIGTIERTPQGKSLNHLREVTYFPAPEGLNEKEREMDLPQLQRCGFHSLLPHLWRA
jgi:hypothetical protein